MNRIYSPCETCTKVDDPEKCTGLRCTIWQTWWAVKWDTICLFLRARLG